MKKLLITGSRGKIGPVLVEAFSKKYDLYEADLRGDDSHRFLKIDVSKIASVDRVFAQLAPTDYLVHLAADSRVDASWESVLQNNIIGVKNTYEACRKYGVKRVIFASSNHVTGGYEGIPPTLHTETNPELITTEHELRPDSDYGASKVFGEAVAREYHELYGIESICLRIGTVTMENNPRVNGRTMRTWLSHRDLVQLVEKSLNSLVKFGVYYAVSDNDGRFWDISKAQAELGYSSSDNAAILEK